MLQRGILRKPAKYYYNCLVSPVHGCYCSSSATMTHDVIYNATVIPMSTHYHSGATHHATNITRYAVCVPVLLSFSFFSGDLANRVPIDTISDYVEEYTPELNYYMTPVIVRAHAILLDTSSIMYMWKSAYVHNLSVVCVKMPSVTLFAHRQA